MSLELQRRLFEQPMSRRELISYVPTADEQFHVQVFRNHSFELIEHTIGAYLDYAGMGVSFSYSGYDDSLSFLELNPNADAIILWIDATRYSESEAEAFLKDRITHLRARYKKPILLIPFGVDVHADQVGVTVFSLKSIQEDLGDGFTDERAKVVTGTSLSNKAMQLISRLLGLQYLPALLRPALKAVVVDLDNTLYQGVLGEDGWNGITLTDGHKLLQQYLKELADKGFFLCVASKNEAEDVEELFEKREDFPLRKRDFAIVRASWASKAEMIGEIAAFLNIATESILFVDDNIGELTAVKMAYPDIKIVHALEEGALTATILKQYPGTMKLASSTEDLKRKDDVQANEIRRTMQQEMSAEEYIRSLDIKLTFQSDNMSQVTRISELANKTNQFIFNYARYTPAEIESRMESQEYRVVAISLADRLSDSGIVGVCVGHHVDDYVEIEECFISCRALGRGIDDVIVLGAMQKITQSFSVEEIIVRFQKGPRNKPAETFVERHLGSFLNTPHSFFYRIPRDLLTVYDY